jgi:hypothetical protein
MKNKSLNLKNLSGCKPIIALKREYDKSLVRGFKIKTDILFTERGFCRDIDLFSHIYKIELVNRGYCSITNTYSLTAEI